MGRRNISKPVLIIGFPKAVCCRCREILEALLVFLEHGSVIFGGLQQGIEAVGQFSQFAVAVAVAGIETAGQPTVVADILDLGVHVEQGKNQDEADYRHGYRSNEETNDEDAQGNPSEISL